MNKPSGAMTLAEGNPDYRTDVDILFGAGREKKDFVLRTTKDNIGLWKTKHGVGISGFKPTHIAPQKWAAQIDRDYWVFGVDATQAPDIFAAVKIGMERYKVKASDLLCDIYVKNLNAEHENEMGRQALIKANQKLYEDTGRAITEAAKLLGFSGIINLHVFSNKKNFKLPKDNLHMALRDSGAESVEMDEKNKFKFDVQNNAGSRVFPNMVTHMHLAKYNV